MAIYGTWQACAAQAAGLPGFADAFAFVQQALEGSHPAAKTLADLPLGETRRVDLDGDRLFANLQHITTKSRAEQQMESHRRYADIQVVVAGSELMEVAPPESLTVTSPYDAATELAFYRMPASASSLIMASGDCAVLFPSDAHAPQLAPPSGSAASRRLVVKVRLDPTAP